MLRYNNHSTQQLKPKRERSNALAESSCQVIYLDKDSNSMLESQTNKKMDYSQVTQRWFKPKAKTEKERAKQQIVYEQAMSRLQKKFAFKYSKNVYQLNRVSPTTPYYKQAALKIQHWFFKRNKADYSLSNLEESIEPLTVAPSKQMNPSYIQASSLFLKSGITQQKIPPKITKTISPIQSFDNQAIIKPQLIPKKDKENCLAYKSLLSDLNQKLKRSVNCSLIEDPSHNITVETLSQGKMSRKSSSRDQSSVDILITKDQLLSKPKQAWQLQPTQINHFTGKRLKRKSSEMRQSQFLEVSEMKRQSRTPKGMLKHNFNKVVSVELNASRSFLQRSNSGSTLQSASNHLIRPLQRRTKEDRKQGKEKQFTLGIVKQESLEKISQKLQEQSALMQAQAQLDDFVNNNRQLIGKGRFKGQEYRKEQEKKCRQELQKIRLKCARSPQPASSIEKFGFVPFR